MTTADIQTSEWLKDPEIRSEYGATTLKYDVAALLIAARKMKNLTQAALANLAGVSQAYIAKLESGEANPTIGRVGAILASMWCKSHMTLAPLVVPERQGAILSASSSASMYGDTVIAQSTANDVPSPSMAYTSAFEYFMPCPFPQSEHRGVANAAL